MGNSVFLIATAVSVCFLIGKYIEMQISNLNSTNIDTNSYCKISYGLRSNYFKMTPNIDNKHLGFSTSYESIGLTSTTKIHVNTNKLHRYFILHSFILLFHYSFIYLFIYLYFSILCLTNTH